jgi:hypothetical protein
MKAWAAMMGIWLSDGHVSNSRGAKRQTYRIAIHQKKEHNIDQIQTGLSDYRPKTREKSRGFRSPTVTFSAPSHQ